MPEVYSQQCSSSMISSYVPIYVIMYGLTGILVPVLPLIVTAKYQDYSVLTDDQRNTLEYMKFRLYFYDNLTQGIVSRMTLPILTRDGSTLVEVIAIHNTNMLDDAESSSVKVIRKFYNMHRLSINYVTQVFLLLTFGLAYPPLAILLLISISMQTIVLQVSIHYHYLQVVYNAFLYKAWSKVLEIELSDLSSQLSGTLTLSIRLSSVFVSFFLVDIISSDRNASYPDTVIIVPVVFILCTGLILAIVSRCRNIKLTDIRTNVYSLVELAVLQTRRLSRSWSESEEVKEVTSPLLSEESNMENIT